MKRKRTSISGLFTPRIILAVVFHFIGISLAISAFTEIGWHDPDRPERYMPVPDGETDDLDGMDTYWHNRLTYPTGRFDPAWVRQASAQDAQIARGVPAGLHMAKPNGNDASLVLDPNGFTALGPRPARMTGCFNCFSYGLTEGRVNDIVVDPTTTTNGSIVAYLGGVGGGVWRTTNCCSGSTTWDPVTDDPLLAAISIDSVTIDPNNHNTIYAGTGDLNFGSFSQVNQSV